VRELCAYWRDGYDWRAHEAALNRFPLFSCEVDGVDLHFWWVRGRGARPLPLLLLHGWPGSMFEFHGLIEPLVDPAGCGGDPGDCFDVVIPSLPGYGFGGAPRDPGWGVTRTATAFCTLMADRLGYPRFGVQGGDWGSIIGHKLAADHPEAVLGLHLNLGLGRNHINLDRLSERASTDEEREVIAWRRAYDAEEFGYAIAGDQADVPGDRPGRLTGGNGRLDRREVPPLERLPRRRRIRVQSRHLADQHHVLLGAERGRIIRPPVLRGAPRRRHGRRRARAGPSALAVFPRESPVARRWMEERFDLRRWTVMPRGGHFPALEQPELLLEDVRAFFRDLRAR
jgi:epoxide hydrolase